MAATCDINYGTMIRHQLDTRWLRLVENTKVAPYKCQTLCQPDELCRKERGLINPPPPEMCSCYFFCSKFLVLIILKDID